MTNEHFEALLQALVTEENTSKCETYLIKLVCQGQQQ